jgi:hypothetical protein
MHPQASDRQEGVVAPLPMVRGVLMFISLQRLFHRLASVSFQLLGILDWRVQQDKARVEHVSPT